jgi:hypothetical protein
MVCALLLLTLTDELTLARFHAISLVGFVFITEFTTGIHVVPEWENRVRKVLVLLLAVFSFIFVDRLLAITPLGG